MTTVEVSGDQLNVTWEDDQGKTTTETFGQLLYSIGRRPNTQSLKLDEINIQLDKHGFVAVDEQMRTNIGHIYAIGDVCISQCWPTKPLQKDGW